MLEAQDISLYRTGKPILDTVSLKVTQGDFISLIGPNGAGKTTLLKILLGVLKPDHGTVVRSPGLKIGYMPQKLMIEPLFPLTARRFLTLARRTTPTELTQISEEIGVEEILDKPVGSLSGGEMQRLLLARALLGSPTVLMLDEPVQNLDIHGQLQFYALLERLYERHNLTIIMVSHDLHMVMRATRRVICLYHHICCEGTPDLVSQHPHFIQLFGEDMSKMLKLYQHTHDHSHAEDCCHDTP